MVITQNIDGLHARAGSKNILELHGKNNKKCQYNVIFFKKKAIEIVIIATGFQIK